MSNIEWNAHVKVDEATIPSKIVGFGWGIPDAEAGDRNYKAFITITLPVQTHAEVQKKSANEKVDIVKHAGLKCAGGIIQAKVEYVVPKQAGQTGSTVDVNVARTSGFKPDPTGNRLASVKGLPIGELIEIEFEIPGSC